MSLTSVARNKFRPHQFKKKKRCLTLSPHAAAFFVPPNRSPWEGSPTRGDLTPRSLRRLRRHSGWIVPAVPVTARARARRGSSSSKRALPSVSSALCSFLPFPSQAFFDWFYLFHIFVSTESLFLHLYLAGTRWHHLSSICPDSVIELSSLSPLFA